ncbi:unnamed protein product [Phytophthora lilii]|uniref:Unnamed protein product n=1 Tax=Phytophthora lilii TaxID=2077276 RepID=A0A9W6TBN8_9STRA|nr:unnamed protein product [Phytophthora lilii]
MELQLNVTARYAAQPSETIGEVLRHFESAAWIRLVLRQVLPQLKQISPTDPAALAKMVRDADTNLKQDISCAICMATDPVTSSTAVELPCGHQFHATCAKSWLQRRSTCPLCRFQLPQAYTGTFAIGAVGSTLLLSPELEHIPSSELSNAVVGGRLMLVAVKITMARMGSEMPAASTRRRKPCQVSVAMVHANASSCRRHDKRRQTPDAAGTVSGVFKRARQARLY